MTDTYRSPPSFTGHGTKCECLHDEAEHDVIRPDEGEEWLGECRYCPCDLFVERKAAS